MTFESHSGDRHGSAGLGARRGHVPGGSFGVNSVVMVLVGFTGTTRQVTDLFWCGTSDIQVKLKFRVLPVRRPHGPTELVRPGTESDSEAPTPSRRPACRFYLKLLK